MSMGAPPELIGAACAKASLPLSEAAQAVAAGNRCGAAQIDPTGEN